MSKPLALTELVLRDAHQSLLATRMRIEDMLPIAEKLDIAAGKVNKLIKEINKEKKEDKSPY